MNIVTTFTRLAEANVELYNNHPTAHKTILAVYTVGAVVGVSAFVRRIAKDDPTLRSGQYAK